ncbi:acyltransferase [Candidatus Chlorohelix sp.]|uniref:acyltransferase n=1 Tax=Candidatus Chlorohelix sp. TaxID=3139201 RepID=UPI00303082C9
MGLTVGKGRKTKEDNALKAVECEVGGGDLVLKVEQIPAPFFQHANVYVHATADVSSEALIGEGTRIWHHVQIREKAVLGKNCIVGKDVYIDSEVVIGDRVKIQNRVSLYKGVMIESGVFIGPHVCFTNDLYPRAINPDGELKTDSDWNVECTLVRYGASIGAGAVILPGVRIGTFALVAAGATVTADVPDHCLVMGTPARVRGYVCRCGRPLTLSQKEVSWFCQNCRESYVFNF